MDLAEEEHRLRDEWVTYRQAGFGLLPGPVVDVHHASPPGQAHDEACLRVHFLLTHPDGADRAMVVDARWWLNRWAKLMGRLAVERSRQVGGEAT